MNNPKETAENLKKSGAYIQGIRPGEQTANYLDTVITRLTVVGSIYLALVALLPEILIVTWHVPFYFGGTSLLSYCCCFDDLYGECPRTLNESSICLFDEEVEVKRFQNGVDSVSLLSSCLYPLVIAPTSRCYYWTNCSVKRILTCLYWCRGNSFNILNR